MKICFLALNAYPLLANAKEIQFAGGAELQQVMIGRGLRDRGHTVSMVCHDFGQPQQTNIDGISVYRAFHPRQGIPVLRFLSPRLTSVWRCLRQADADIYYYRTAGMWAGIISTYARRQGRYSIFAAAGNPDLEKNTSRIRYARDRLIYEHGLRNVDRIFVQNQLQAELCREVYAREPVCIPNCFEPVASASPPESGRILWVSTIRRVKRPALFLELAAALPQYQFQMVGGPDAADPGLFESVQSRAATLANLDFVGYVPFSEIGDYFDKASLFVNTSESEGFPNTFMQSWARRIPTVSFVDSGARYFGRSVGRRVSELQEMISTVGDLMSDKPARHSLGDDGYRYVTENHSLQHILDLYEQAFDEIPSRGSAIGHMRVYSKRGCRVAR